MKLSKHKLIFKNKYGYKFWNDTLEDKSGNKRIYDYLEREEDYVVIIPIDKDGNFYFVKHYRYPIKKEILEFPVGYINRNEAPLAAAKRELYEEIGGKSSNVSYLGYVWQAPGILKLKCHIFIANNVETQEVSTDIDEGLKIVKIKAYRMTKLIRTKKIEDSSSLVALARYLTNFVD